MLLNPTVKATLNKNRPSFSTDKLKIVFSNASIQPFDEYGYVKDTKSIMHLYYSVDGYIKKDGKWKTVFSARTFDFPGVIDFCGILEDFITKTLPLDIYQKIENKHGTLYSFHQNTGYYGEDFYNVTHKVAHYGGSEHEDYYTITIGAPNPRHHEERKSITFDVLRKEDIEEMYKCVTFFLDQILKNQNEQTIAYNKKQMQSWKTKANNLHQTANNKTQIENIFTVGDKVDITVLRGDIETKDFYSESYENTTIKTVCDDSIIIDGGYIDQRHSSDCPRIENIKVPISTIIYMFCDIDNEKLYYNEEEIANDFICLLTDDEKTEFKDADADSLFNKWAEAILNRTWMCRKEHALPIRAEDKGNHENVYASIRYIVGMIKGKLTR